MNKVKISRAYCEEHFDQCFFEHNENTGQTSHIESFTERKAQLEGNGYIYTGHSQGVMTFQQRNTHLTALPLDWQMAADERELIDVNQDW